jgi:non-specific serine/threonine protein kinase/serine/threonine-protein kinase
VAILEPGFLRRRLAREEPPTLHTPPPVPAAAQVALRWTGEPAASEPQRLGPYRLLGRLGEGGMGVVYRAEQTEPVERQVALKVIRAARLDAPARRRFGAERQALARLAHPHVARLYEAGTTEDGHPFFAMELVEGEPITSFCDARRLDLAGRLELFRAVCEGVHHAHQKGLLHRDLKPSNILVTAVDGRPVPKIIDFGVAKALDRPLADGATEEGIFGTPLYLAPECYDGAGEADLDTRSDVYGLGVLLYELLVGVHPFGDDDLSIAQLLPRVLADRRDAPSARLAAQPAARREGIAAGRGVAGAALARRLRGELDWIALRAVARERERRYGSASDLAADVARALRHEPVLAAPPSGAYRLRKLVRRRRGAVAAAALLVGSLAAGVVARSVEVMRANREAEAARLARLEAEEAVSFLVDTFASSDPEEAQGRTVTARELLARGAARLETDALRSSPLVRARLLATIADAETALAMAREALPHAREALALRERVLGRRHPDVAYSLRQVGLLRYQLGELDAASAFLRRAYAIGEELSPDDPAHAVDHAALAHLAVRRGELRAAERLYRRARSLYQRAGGAHRRELASTIGNLAVAVGRQGRADEALALHREALTHLVRLEGPQSSAVAGSLLNIAAILVGRGRAAEALPLLERALAIRERVYGGAHPRVARVLFNLAKARHQLGELDAARAFAERALALRVAALGPDHPDVAHCHAELGELAQKAGDPGAAEAHHRRALAIWERAYGSTHVYTAFPRASLGLLALDRGELALAERELRQAVAMLATGDPVDLAWGQWALARVLRARGRDPAEAEELLRRSLAVRSRELPAGDHEVRDSRGELAALLRDAGRTAEAAAIESQTPPAAARAAVGSPATPAASARSAAAPRGERATPRGATPRANARISGSRRWRPPGAAPASAVPPAAALVAAPRRAARAGAGTPATRRRAPAARPPRDSGRRRRAARRA